MSSRKPTIPWLIACCIALPAQAITFERLVDCCPVDPYIFYGIGEPALSPDGRWLATTNDTTSPPIYEWWPSVSVSNREGADGFTVRPPNHDGWVNSAVWSPDGQWLAFIATGFGTTDGIWVLDIAARENPSAYRHVTETPWGGKPSWSPDGASIVFSTGEIYRVNSGGGMPSPIGAMGHSPSCGPNGAVGFVRDTDLWIVDGDRHERRLTNTPAQEAHPAWSPDGRWIAFTSNRSGNWDIWLIAATGGTPVQVTHDRIDEISPSWASDARLVFMSSADQNDFDVWLATDLPDWTVPVEGTSWTAVKSLYR